MAVRGKAFERLGLQSWSQPREDGLIGRCLRTERAVLANDVYKARHDGTDNPNIAMLHELKQAGVELRVCGQGLLGKKVDPKDVLPDVQVDLWAMTTMVNLQVRGYVRIGG